MVTPLLSDADVTERLLSEFETTHGLRLISGLIRGCRAELRATQPAYPAESLEALVRSRLAALHPTAMRAGAA